MRTVLSQVEKALDDERETFSEGFQFLWIFTQLIDEL